MKLRYLISGSLFAVSCLLWAVEAETVAAENGKPGPWAFEFELYGLMANIYGDSTMGVQPGSLPAVDVSGDVDIPFSKILETIQMGAMAHFEVHHQSGWGIWLDYAFMNLKDDSDIGYLNKSFAEVGLKQGVLEAFVLYRQPLGEEYGYIDYFGGIRWWDNNFDLKLSSDLPFPGGAASKSWSRSEYWVDPVIGVRWTLPISESWSFRLRGDMGGFDIGSRFTTASGVGFLYGITDWLELDLRFKALWVDYETGHTGEKSHFIYKAVTYGPIVGLNLKF
ncbi:MAG TPA: hypothetical protein ENH12_03725 [Proteobacteria bacterium]|nr:hypothetical protein [Pseudomonadota bacterium]